MNNLGNRERNRVIPLWNNSLGNYHNARAQNTNVNGKDYGFQFKSRAYFHLSYFSIGDVEMVYISPITLCLCFLVALSSIFRFNTTFFRQIQIT